MRKSQLVIIAVSILVVIALFNLPKMIVENEKNPDVQSDSSHKMKSGPITDISSNGEITASDKEILSSLRKNFLSVSDNQKKRIFADSIARYYLRLKQYDSSFLYFDQYQKLQAGESDFLKAAAALTDAADSAPEAEKVKIETKARSFYTMVLEKNPKNYDAKNKLAMSYVAGENPMQGVTLLKEILKEDPLNESANYNLGNLYIQIGSLDKAVERFKQVIKKNPANSKGYFYLGYSLMQQGKNKEATEAFTKAKSLDKDPEVQSTIDGYLDQMK